MKKLSIILIIFMTSLATAQEKKIPEWFLNDLEESIGTWIADNKNYVSENEPFTHYGIEWSWGLGKTTMKGRLFGLIDGEGQGDFWEFRQYWDNVNEVAVVEQFGNGGMIGIGSLQPIDEYTTESVQTFSLPNGNSWKDRHISIRKKTELITTSYKMDSEGKWVENRTYSWTKKN